MKYNQFLKMTLAVALCGSLITGCSKDNDTKTDTEYPVIDVTTSDAFPKQCSELRRGTAFSAKIIVSDNAELGSVSIDIHHNFDHHTHSTELDDCGLDALKTPVNPFTLIKSFPIPAGNKNHMVSEEIQVPATIDPGDYHFMIRATDREGWQTIKGLSIKIK
ncbi:DUF4625 domain-containing protein [Niabella beijingensis]|uniref:DUF4625 domain-containing protein n=1 Tax=Niabella beijingensis TaxID=2872700 RepID=UPI001CBEE930|nr:DUF4625 domain-containing protein [Niabella beijingensis]MBZ4192473.1 DUF4625 domain-containing protein [Niabella beijingensis]